ncbi:TonB-dependent receptor [Ideonella sp. 4Y11]|uniref:TonB-dependent receptor n=1 Tax=Ideonella aquatica TaxID=2824119 RepID=A0A940YS21_9BURK|nr:TonB-dependent receptor [Ideonella aquatica]MBQ0960908.1 TonB-dependent receptor [Ideonella aquatica]
MSQQQLTPLNQVLLAAGLVAASLPGWAQDANAPAAPAERKPVGVQEVIVTATKVATPASKTPLALTVVSGDDLKAAGVTEARNLEEVTPNLQMAQESGKLQIAIRGVTSLDMTEKGDPSAAFNVDGAYIARYEAQTGAFMDLERIEVLRGPQGTLYGRNATAGAINLITNKPGRTLGGRIEGEFGNYGARRVEGMINVPINDILSMRAVVQKSQRDATIDPGTNTGTPMDKRSDYAARVHLLADISKTSSLLLTAETTHQGGGAPTPVPMGNFFTGTYVDNLPFSPPNTGNNIKDPVWVDRGTSAQRTAGLNFKGATNPAYTDNDNHSLRAEYKTSLGFADLTYQLAYMKGLVDGSGNGIYFGFPIVLKGQGDSDSTSHEVRLNSVGNGPLKWVAGAYLFNERIHRESSFNTFITAPFGSFTVVLPFDIDVKNKSKAVFGQATYALLPETRLTLGLRETRDQKDGSDKLGGQAATPPATTSPGAYTKSVKFSNFSYRLGVEHDLAAGTMLYASLATGYKAGGFNDTSDGGNYKPEHLSALEAGVKTKLLNDRLRLSAGVFTYDYKDMQQTSVVCKTNDPSSCGSVTTNAASAKITGAEVEARWMVGDNGELRGSLALNDAKFKDYQPNTTTDWSNQVLDRAPRSVLTLGYSHRFNLESGADITASIGTRLNSGYKLSDPAAAIRYTQPSFHKSDASLAWTSPDQKTSVQLFVKNIENTTTIESRVPGSFFIGDPRTYGVRASYSF